MPWCSFSRIRYLHLGPRFRVLGIFGFEPGVFVFEFRVLRIRIRGSSFLSLGDRFRLRGSSVRFRVVGPPLSQVN